MPNDFFAAFTDEIDPYGDLFAVIVRGTFSP